MVGVGILLFNQSVFAQGSNFEPASCPFEMPAFSFASPETFGFECGYVTVPEEHNQPDGVKIRLPVAIYRAVGSASEPDPIFLAQGGPGGSAFEVFSLIASNSDLAQKRDIVIFNQRGTLYTEPDLLCEEAFEAQWQALGMPADASTDSLVSQAYTDCYNRLIAEGVNLSAYDSIENAGDVDAIRSALGYEQINFYGVSYGTLLGLHLMQNYPDHLRSVILDGVVPTNLNFLTGAPGAENRAYDQYFAYCEADAECRQLYPNLENRYFALLDKLDATPATLTLRDEETGKKYDAILDGETLRGVVFQMFYIPKLYAAFPKLVADLEREKYGALETVWSLLAFDRTISEGMYFSVVCAEDADFAVSDVDATSLRPRVAEGVTGELSDMLEICEMWRVAELPASVDDPVQSNIPTLLLSGAFDPITPPPYAELAAQSLPNSYVVVDNAGSHGVALGGSSCIDRIMSDFVDNPNHQPDTNCLSSTTLDKAVPDDIIYIPFMGDLITLSGGIGWKIATVLSMLCCVVSAFVILPGAFLFRKIANKPKLGLDDAQQRSRVGWALLISLFGLLATIFVIGLAYYAGTALPTPMLWLSAISGSARLLFLLPLLLLLLLPILCWAYLRGWSSWSLWGRLYNGLLMLCTVGFVGMLFAGNLLFTFFS